MKKNKNVLVSVILDKSGSMTTVRDNTISGFNEYLNNLKNTKDIKYDINLTLFDTDVIKGKTISLDDQEMLTIETYVPSGMTALYDAVCMTIKEIEKEKKKTLVVIITDGEENSSKEYTQEQFKTLVEEKTKEGNFTFVYLGANQDAWQNASRYGFNKDNVSNFNNSSAGVKNMYDNLSKATACFSSDIRSSTPDFFNDEQKKSLEETK